MPPLYTLQLSYRRPTRLCVPNVIKIAIAGLLAWCLAGLVAWGVVVVALA